MKKKYLMTYEILISMRKYWDTRFYSGNLKFFFFFFFFLPATYDSLENSEDFSLPLPLMHNMYKRLHPAEYPSIPQNFYYESAIDAFLKYL